MKKIRIVSFVVCAALAVTMSTALIGCSDLTTSSGPSGSTSSAAAKNYITKADFDKIQNGMSYAQVKKIIGCDGDILSETGTKGDSLYTVMYDWKGQDGISNADFEFQGDKLQNKSQAGLQ